MENLSYALPFASYKLTEMYRRYFAPYVVVNTTLGPIRGLEVPSDYDYKYAQFQGIPYARPPIGELRFQDPVPAEPWTNVLTTTSDTKCCQRDIFSQRFVGSEDCLHLNVYTKELSAESAKDGNENKPSNASGASRPVMVFLHGGAFIFGSNSKDLYNPEYLLRKDIVLVVVNYRLGALGFLSVDDQAAAAPGNAGLKDQVLALKWIRDNIARFGGDPKNVTLFGESAGGCSVHYHLLSDMSRGLFHKAILMSGSVLNSWSICPLKNGPERLAKCVGWNGEGGPDQMMKVLRATRSDSLMKAQESMINKEEKRQYIMFPFGPGVEQYKSAQTFIPDDPAKMCERPAWSDQMPVIFSACSSEGLLMHKAIKKRPILVTNLVERFQDMVPLDLCDHQRESPKGVELGAAFKKFYFGFTEPAIGNILTFEQMMADKLFHHGIHRSICHRLSRPNAGPTYFLRFDFDSNLMNLMRFIFAGRDIKGTCHADDCNYLFKNCVSPKMSACSAENKAIERFVDFFTEFARTGNPNSERTQAIVQWDPIPNRHPADDEEHTIKCLNLSNEMTFIEQPELERMRFWDTLYAQQKLGSNQLIDQMA